VLRKAGFVVVSQRGSYVKLRAGEITVIVPVYGSKPLKRGTMTGVFKDAGLTAKDVKRLS